jgi:endonuclease/exonuclease/phosphatase family metal-dependent hydrolase
MQLARAKVAPAAAGNANDAWCCTKCAGKFCSTVSGNCYDSKRKHYYQSCEDYEPVPERRLAVAPSSESSVKLMSYNLFGWNAFNQHKWKSNNILDKIRSFGPSVLGAQEVETGGGHGSSYVSGKVESATGLHGGGSISQFYDSGVLEAHESKNVALVRGYWMFMTRYTHKASNVSFLFFNSHWKHGYASEQKEIIAEAIHAERKKYGNPPTILVGDTNQFCQAREREALRYLLGEEGSSPVTFVDAIAQDRGHSYDGGCRVDFILATEGQWLWVDSKIDREGMGQHGSSSDHAALMAELVPIAGEVSAEA